MFAWILAILDAKSAPGMFISQATDGTDCFLVRSGSKGHAKSLKSESSRRQGWG
jgi:hypothetical protein